MEAGVRRSACAFLSAQVHWIAPHSAHRTGLSSEKEPGRVKAGHPQSSQLKSVMRLTSNVAR